MKKLAPSILSADFSKLAEDVKLIEKGGADLIHVDVMDGHFVPNISYGATVMKSLLGKTRLPFDVHLMIEDPDKYIEDFITEKTEYVTVHEEACRHLHRTVCHIREHGIRAGVAVNPATPVSALEEILPEVDMVLLMSVDPGFGGQSFIGSVLKKAEKLDKIRKECGLDFELEMDGGINKDNLKSVLEVQTDIIVAGSSIFCTEDITGSAREFCAEIKEGNYAIR